MDTTGNTDAGSKWARGNAPLASFLQSENHTEQTKKTEKEKDSQYWTALYGGLLFEDSTARGRIMLWNAYGPLARGAFTNQRGEPIINVVPEVAQAPSGTLMSKPGRGRLHRFLVAER